MRDVNKSANANDYAIAQVMNHQIYSTIVVIYLGDVAGVSEHKEIPDLNRAYILLVNELEKIYQRNPELQAIRPEPLWGRFSLLKNHTAEIRDYIDDTEDWGLEHNAKVERLCIIADIDKPSLSSNQQNLIDDLDIYTKKYSAKIQEKMETKESSRQIPSYELTYELDGTILINGAFRLKKAHAGSSTERLLEQALRNPNKLFKPDLGQTSRNLSTVLSSAGFTKELRQLFFPTVSESRGIIFRPIVARELAESEKIDTSKLDTTLMAFGAETEPKTT